MPSSEQSLPDPQAAYSHLFDNVHSQVFFGKLASFGIQPTTDKEASDLFELAARLRHVDTEKQASSESRYGGALQALDQTLGRSPEGQQQKAAAQQQAVKQAAANLMEEEGIYNAVLALKAQEAATLSGSDSE